MTRGPVLAAAVIVFLALSYVWWRRRRNRSENPETQAPKRPHEGNAQTSVALYRALETALQLQGVIRVPSLPPLRHAEELRLQRHPLAEEVFALTAVYIETRFGGTALTDAARRDFERRIRDIRGFRGDGPAAT